MHQYDPKDRKIDIFKIKGFAPTVYDDIKELIDPILPQAEVDTPKDMGSLGTSTILEASNFREISLHAPYGADPEALQQLKGNFKINLEVSDCKIEYCDPNQTPEKILVNWQRAKDFVDTDFIFEEEEKAEKEKPFKDMYAKLLYFPNTDEALQQQMQTEVFRFSQFMTDTAQTVLRKNYQLAGIKGLTFEFNRPPTPNSIMEYSRKNNVITLTLFSPISIVYYDNPDESRSAALIRYGLTFNEELVQLERSDYKAYDSRIICTLNIQASIDLEALNDLKQPHVSMEITVSTLTSVLQYIGPQNASYISQLQTHLNLPMLTNPKSKEIENIKEYLLISANLNIGQSIGKLCNGSRAEQPFDISSQLIFQVLDEIFEQALIIRLLKHKLDGLSNNAGPNELLEGSALPPVLKDLLRKRTKEGFAFFSLLNEINEELNQSFCQSAFSKSILTLSKIFSSNLVEEFHASAKYLAAHKLEFPNYNISNYLFLTALESIKTALEYARRFYHIEIIGDMPLKKISLARNSQLNADYLSFLEHLPSYSAFLMVQDIPEIKGELAEHLSAHPPKRTPNRKIVSFKGSRSSPQGSQVYSRSESFNTGSQSPSRSFNSSYSQGLSLDLEQGAATAQRTEDAEQEIGSYQNPRAATISIAPTPANLPATNGWENDQVRALLNDLDAHPPTTPDRQVILDIQMPKVRRRAGCSQRTEVWAAFIERNPFINALLMAGAFRYSAAQYLKLFSGTAPYVQTLLIPEVYGIATGAYTGYYRITHPNQPLSTFLRVNLVVSRGLIVLIFSLGAAIDIYLIVNPGTQFVSDTVFLSQIQPGPAALGLGYIVWNSIANETRERWFSRNVLSRFTKNALDIFCSALLYGGIMEFISINWALGSWLSLMLPVGLSIIPAILEYTRFRETTSAFMTAVNGGEFYYLIVLDAMHRQPPEVLAWTRLGLWSCGLLAGVGYGLKSSFRFVNEYQSPPIVTLLRTPSPEVYQALLQNTPDLPELDSDSRTVIDNWQNTPNSRRDQTVAVLYQYQAQTRRNTPPAPNPNPAPARSFTQRLRDNCAIM